MLHSNRESDMSDGSNMNGSNASVGMPVGVRRTVIAAVAGGVALALYLLSVRGPALLMDIATGVANAFCF